MTAERLYCDIFVVSHMNDKKHREKMLAIPRIGCVVIATGGGTTVVANALRIHLHSVTLQEVIDHLEHGDDIECSSVSIRWPDRPNEHIYPQTMPKAEE